MSVVLEKIIIILIINLNKLILDMSNYMLKEDIIIVYLIKMINDNIWIKASIF